MTKQQARLIYWTSAQLAFSRAEFPGAGSFTAEDPGPGAYGANLSDDELAVMMRIDWKRVGLSSRNTRRAEAAPNT